MLQILANVTATVSSVGKNILKRVPGGNHSKKTVLGALVVITSVVLLRHKHKLQGPVQGQKEN